MKLPFKIETELEARVCADPDWEKGVVWGKPRPGHSEGQVIYHIAEVLANVDHQAITDEERRILRLVTLIHDTFKYRVDGAKPRIGDNHHAVIARRFAERYIDDVAVLEIIELHDEAFHSWQLGASYKKWDEAEKRVEQLVTRLGSLWWLYLRFFRADNQTASKERDSVLWFEEFLRRKGYPVPPAEIALSKVPEV